MIAQTILQQLGGNRFITMTGAKSFVNGHSYLQFRIPRNASKGNVVVIALNKNDLYDVSFKRIRNYQVETMLERNDVSVEQLREMFENVTGLKTSLK